MKIHVNELTVQAGWAHSSSQALVSPRPMVLPIWKDTWLTWNKWRFSLILVCFSASENEWDRSYNRNWSDLNIFPIIFYLHYRLPISYKALYQWFQRWIGHDLGHWFYREPMQATRITPLQVGVLNLSLLLSFNFSGWFVNGVATHEPIQGICIDVAMW